MKSIDILWGTVEETVAVEDIIKEETKRVAPIGIGSVLSDGYIIYAETDTEWLAVAPANKRGDYEWGSFGKARGTISETDGYANTDTLVGLGGHPAAKFAWNNSRSPAEGGTGSYLPSKDELNTIYENRELIDAADTSGGEFTLAAIEAGATRPNKGSTSAFVWSSTEYTPSISWIQNFSLGNQLYYGKYFSYWVVPMRRIDK